MDICNECESQHDDDLLCVKCKHCLANSPIVYEDNIGMIHVQCGKCSHVCLVDPSAFSDNDFSTEVFPEQNPAELERTYDEEYGTDSEGYFPLDTPVKQLTSNQRFKIWPKQIQNDN